VTQAEENKIASTVTVPEVASALADIKIAAHTNYYMDDDTFIDYILALTIANKFDAEPLWGFLVGPPSSLKTQLLVALKGCPWVNFLSTLTPQTLISGWSNRSGKNCSLLPKLGGRVLVIKEFTSVLQMRTEWRAEIFAQLREIYDGYYTKYFGTGEKVDWEGKMGLIAAVTPEIERYTSVNQTLGERFLYYRMPANSQHAVAARSRENTTRLSGKRVDVGDAILAHLDLFDNAELNFAPCVSTVMENKLDSLAVFCANGRTPVIRDHYDRSRIDVMPETEGVGRVSQQLCLLSYALAAIRGIAGVDEGVYEVVKRVAASLIPRRRMKIMQFLYGSRQENPSQFYSAEVVGVKLGVPSQTCRYDLDDLFMVGIVEKNLTKNELKSVFRASDSFLSDAENCEIFDFGTGCE
jgi:hypothetical protein